MTFAQRRNRLTTHFAESIPVVKLRMTVNTFLILHVHKSTIAILRQKAENESTMCLSHLNISMLDSHRLGLNGEILALFLEVSLDTWPYQRLAGITVAFLSSYGQTQR